MIYFIRNPETDLIKIGTSKGVSMRLADLCSQHKTKLVVLGIMDGERKAEASLHRRFAGCRAHGEWFEPALELVQFIDKNALPWDRNSSFGNLGRKIKVTISVDEDVWAEIQAHAAKAGVSASWITEHAIRQYLKEAQCHSACG